MMRGLRHPADGRLQLPLHPVHARVRSGPRGADRHRPELDRHALPLRGQHGRRRRDHPAGVDPAAAPQGRPLVARDDRSQRGALVGDHGTPRPMSTPIRSIRCGCSPNCPPGCPTTRSSPPIPVRPPTGTPGNCGSAATCADRCRATSRPWDPGCPTESAPSSATPTGRSIVFAGDGAMQMNGLAELITIKRYWRQWDDPRLVVAVLHNNDLNQVTWEMRAMAGAPKFVESQTLPDVDYAAFAASLGLARAHSHGSREARRRWERRCPRTGRPCSTCTATPTCRRFRRTPPGSK